MYVRGDGISTLKEEITQLKEAIDEIINIIVKSVLTREFIYKACIFCISVIVGFAISDFVWF